MGFLLVRNLGYVYVHKSWMLHLECSLVIGKLPLAYLEERRRYEGGLGGVRELDAHHSRRNFDKLSASLPPVFKGR